MERKGKKWREKNEEKTLKEGRDAHGRGKPKGEREHGDKGQASHLSVKL